MKTALIDVGGGLRGVYAAGVLDYCLDEKIAFDLCIGISAGSANVAAYLAGQRGRNYRYYTQYPFRKEYMSLQNFRKKKSYLDLDYIYGTLSVSGGEDPLDYAALAANPAECLVVACNAQTGETKYFDKAAFHQDDYSILKASSAIPLVCHPYAVEGTAYYDGALADTIPIEKAFAMGCDVVVLLLTKPADTLRTDKKDRILARGIQRRYPMAAQRLRGRAQRYNDGVALARELERQGKLLIVAPENTEGVDTLTRDREALERLYRRGYRDARCIPAFIAGARSSGQRP